MVMTASDSFAHLLQSYAVVKLSFGRKVARTLPKFRLRLSTSIQKRGSQFVGQVANLPFARQVGNLPHEFGPPILRCCT